MRHITKFLNDRQYLVTLKTRKRRKALKTEIPYDAFGLIEDATISKTLPPITIQSKRLNDD